MASDKSLAVCYYDALAMLPDSEYIKTLRQTWDGEWSMAQLSREQAVILLRTGDPHPSGPFAEGLGFGIVVNNVMDGVVFIETKGRGDEAVRTASETAGD